jgi:NAD(P)-dependent dehydrogenase (short-subunit alcohol dehydrogenase family)
MSAPMAPSLLQGRIALITGSSSGIGAACAKSLAGQGMQVIMAARRLDKLQALSSQFAGDHPKPEAYQLDVRNEAEIIALFAHIRAKYGRLDLLVNSAGFADHTPTTELSLARWSDIVATNLTGPFLCAREAFKLMKPQKRGRIINIGSVSAQISRPNAIGYTSTKFALDGMTRSLALDGREDGICVSIVHPGSTKTELMPGMDDKPADQSMLADDVARTVVLMASLPDETNLLEATILPVRQPFLGRG